MRRETRHVTGSQSSYEPDRFHSQASVERFATIVARPVRPVVVGPRPKAYRFGSRGQRHALQSRRNPLDHEGIGGEEASRPPSARGLTMQKNLMGVREERRRIIFASVAGTTIEFFDFYIYATAAISVFPLLFFPKGEGTAALLASMATFGVAFVARPIGSVLFGHFGDRAGRKATLIGSLLVMGLATFAIGLLPTYQQIGLLAPSLLAILRFCQGLGLGGEWSGAALLASETAEPGKRAQAAMWPQLGAPFRLPAGEWFLPGPDDCFWISFRLISGRRPLFDMGLAHTLPHIDRHGPDWSLCANKIA